MYLEKDPRHITQFNNSLPLLLEYNLYPQTGAFLRASKCVRAPSNHIYLCVAKHRNLH